ncbi:hypothetical protein [Streptomyces phytophilus]|uniref:hypothetical protein n=1 Tax=Streptomyces phytophilus TaxID=722715 RepID=UPI0015F0A4DA|nr:hypothetical protein [Streptomyces phytophilus]
MAFDVKGAFLLSSMRPVVDVSLRFGFTLEQVNRMARHVSHTHRGSHFGNIDERFDIAWSAMVEIIYSSDACPEPSDLFRGARRALNKDTAKTQHAHGLDPHGMIEGMRPCFVRYWSSLSSPTQSPENSVVERRALWEIWQVLRPFHREALGTLAAYDGDYELAAAALGKTPRQFSWHIREARRSFMELWHEGETPSGVWAKYQKRGEGYRPTDLMRNFRARQRRRARRGTAIPKKIVGRKTDLGISDKEIARRYERESARSIAASLGCSHSTINSRLKEMGIERRGVGTRPPKAISPTQSKSGSRNDSSDQERST